MATTKKKIVLGVDLPDDKQKKKALKAVSALSGIDSVTMDTRAHKMTVIGCVDPVDVVCKLRKLWFTVHIVTVWPSEEKQYYDKKPEREKEKEKPKPCPVDYYTAPLRVESFPLEFLNRITYDFSEERIIDRGRYGAIYKGILDNGRCIAVKKLNLKPGIVDEDFKNEFNKLRRIQHRNTIRLVGYCYHVAQVPVEHNGEYVSARVEERALCFEYLEGQSLDKHLSNEPCGLDWYICYRIIKGICDGLHYLHKELEHPIYHLDLKPTNILLDRDTMMPKIRCSGLSLFDSLETNNISEDMETNVYMPPEYIDKHQTSPKFDVFSLGVIIIQIMAGKESYSKLADTPPEEFIQLVHELWANRVPETSWRHASREVRACIEMALECVKSDQVMRPTINDIVDNLNKIYIADWSSIDQLYKTREFTFEFLKRITNNFSTQNIVGHGGFGVIYKGVLDNGEEVAVKRLYQNQMVCIGSEQFRNELNKLMRVQHKNIVQLVGYCNHTTPKHVEYNGKLVVASVEERAICLEYLEGRSLDKHLSDEACILDWDTCYKIIKGICEGLHYLHNGSDHRIYHMDLKPANILLDKDMTPKIGDFGLSRLFDSAQTYITQSENVTGTLGYMPPEYMDRRAISPNKFDVFSLGVIIIRMMAGKEGYIDCAETPPEEFIKLVHGNWRKRLPETTMSSYYASEEVRTCVEIALRCVERDRAKRPTISQIVKELSNIGTANGSPAGQSHHEEDIHDICVHSDSKSSPTEKMGWRTSLLFTHFKYWFPLLVALVAMFLAWPRLCPGYLWTHEYVGGFT